MMQDHAIWVFDDVCVLCNRGVQFTLRHERAPSIQFVALQSDQGQKLAQQNGIDPLAPASFLFIENGVALDKSDALIALSKHLKSPARYASLLRVLPRPLRDAAYRFVARNRYKFFGKLDTCPMPRPDQRHRFIL